jgi:hypothetical protein
MALVHGVTVTSDVERILNHAFYKCLELLVCKTASIKTGSVYNGSYATVFEYE